MTSTARNILLPRRQFCQGLSISVSALGLGLGPAAACLSHGSPEFTLNTMPSGNAVDISVTVRNGHDTHQAIQRVQVFAPARPDPEILRLDLDAGRSELTHDMRVPGIAGQSLMAVATLTNGAHIIRRTFAGQTT